jgi:protocatechuate 3,4-dioxygenase beta subunit
MVFTGAQHGNNGGRRCYTAGWKQHDDEGVLTMNDQGQGRAADHGRRRIVVAAGTAVAMAAAWPLRSRSASPTPACGSPTHPQTEGPYFAPQSPQRADLVEPGIEGQALTLSGIVSDAACRPIAGTLIDIWQADAAGRYDNTGFRLRGHLFSDDQGRFVLRTIVPGAYPGRTRHLHLRLQPPGGRVLTTQLYFPDDPGNPRDGLFDPALLMKIQVDGPARAAAFGFVLAGG